MGLIVREWDFKPGIFHKSLFGRTQQRLPLTDNDRLHGPIVKVLKITVKRLFNSHDGKRSARPTIILGQQGKTLIEGAFELVSAGNPDDQSIGSG